MILLNLGIQDIGDGFCYTDRCDVGKSLIDSCKKLTGVAIPSLIGAPVMPCYVIALCGWPVSRRPTCGIAARPYL
jgi:hypothetical protein